MKRSKVYITSIFFLLGTVFISEAQTWRTNSGNFYANPTTTRLGIGTGSPNSMLHVNAGSGVDGLRIQLSGSTRMFLSNNGGLAVGNYVTPPARGLYVYNQIGIGTTAPISWAKLDIKNTGGSSHIRLMGADDKGNYSGINFTSDESTDKQWEIVHRSGYWGTAQSNVLLFAYNDGSNWSNPLIIKPNGNVGIGVEFGAIVSKLHVGGTTTTEILQITGGSDLAESFEINADRELKPGMLVSIDPENPGRLKLASSEYDRKVAGIISGANNIKTGLLINQEGTVANGEFPVALAGRVYCYVDASKNAVEPGDLLTTSNTPGYAMKVEDFKKANGSSIGKAMTSLKREEKGLILVLVTLK